MPPSSPCSSTPCDLRRTDRPQPRDAGRTASTSASAMCESVQKDVSSTGGPKPVRPWRSTTPRRLVDWSFHSTRQVVTRFLDRQAKQTDAETAKEDPRRLSRRGPGLGKALPPGSAARASACSRPPLLAPTAPPFRCNAGTTCRSSTSGIGSTPSTTRSPCTRRSGASGSSALPAAATSGTRSGGPWSQPSSATRASQTRTRYDPSTRRCEVRWLWNQLPGRRPACQGRDRPPATALIDHSLLFLPHQEWNRESNNELLLAEGAGLTAAVPGNCTNMIPRPREIKPVMSTQTAATRSIWRRDEWGSSEPPTPVRIMIGAVLCRRRSS